jgi:biopolymer transport protein ExbD
MAIPIRSDDDEDLHDINVTPFIDVILVLLIVFMIAAPLATVDLPVDLPSANVARQPRPEEPLFVTLRADLSLVVGETVVAPSALAGALDTAADGDRERRVFVRADRAVAYGDLMEAMNELRAAGYLKIALVGLEARPAGRAGAP